MNALVALDYGNYLHPKTRESFEDAAQRWGCDFVPMHTPIKLPGVARVHHFWQKTLLPFDKNFGLKYDRLAVLDGDMLIREDCPSLFEVVPRENIGVVCRHQPGYNRSREPQSKLVFWAKRLKLTCPRHDRFLNGGLVVYTPEVHQRWLEAWREAARGARWRPLQGSDQTSLSVILHGMEAPVTWLPWTYNTVATPRPQSPLGPMKTYIYHFNRGGGKAGYHGRVAQCQWRTHAPQ